ncbi:MAG: MarR family transcriptional regulator [Solirubrobacterales bacterium]|nr:MarR family transcriptional regulator [Solirubrobacterales bacterium]
MAAAMAERSANASTVTLAAVQRRAGVSEEAFEELFEDREACVLAAFELGVERAAEQIVPAYRAESRWLDAIKVALAAFLRFLEAEPELGRMLVVHALAGGPRVLRRRGELLARLAEVVDRGRGESLPGRVEPPGVIAEGIVGAVLAVIHNRLQAERPEPPIELFGALASIIVLPYMGASVARRELTRPAPPPRATGPERSELESRSGYGRSRLTYRTARVLGAIAGYPGASNREVAERAGIVDQGQISKLLTRLEGRGLIVKIGESRTRGAPNSWQLTDGGEALMASATVRGAMRLPRDPDVL